MDEVLHVGCLGCAVGLSGKHSKIKNEKDAHVRCQSGMLMSYLSLRWSGNFTTESVEGPVSTSLSADYVGGSTRVEPVQQGKTRGVVRL